MSYLRRDFKRNTYKHSDRSDTRAPECSWESYQSDFAYFRKVCRDRSWCVCGSAEMPCALRVLGPISWALGKTDWHLCSFLFSSWISSSLSARRLSKSRILSSLSSRILAKSSSRSLMSNSALNFSRLFRVVRRKKKNPQPRTAPGTRASSETNL